MLNAELEQIGVRGTMVLDKTSHADELAKPPAATGWIRTPRGETEMRRILYLAGLRNLSLKPLASLAESGERYDRILFLNDVVFTVCYCCYVWVHPNSSVILTSGAGAGHHDIARYS